MTKPLQPADAWPPTEEAKELLPDKTGGWCQPKPPNESGEALCKVRWMLETPGGWIGAYDREAFDAFVQMLLREGWLS